MNVRMYPQVSEAHIHFFIAKSSWVELSILDHSGQKIATLFKDNKQKGNYGHTWDTSKLTKGAYFIQLHTEGRRLVKKLVLSNNS